jgi:cytochrome c-type biogenesis protein CcmE
MSIRARLFVGVLVLVAVTIYVAYLGASSSWQYYLTVDECAASIQRFTSRQLRVSGRIGGGTLQIANDRKSATFVLEGESAQLATNCEGPLPDNLAEGVNVVVEGSLHEGGTLQARKVLTRCASKYESQH